MKFSDIPKFTRTPSYRCSVDWSYLKESLGRWQDRKEGLAALDLNPEFQRLHVWTDAQKTAYVEYILQGGTSGREIYFNCNGWQSHYKGPFVLVDGKQRIDAVLQFLNDNIKAFGLKCSQFEGRLPYTASFNFNVNDLPTMKEVIQWYLEMNTGGTPHTKEEIAKAQALLENCK